MNRIHELQRKEMADEDDFAIFEGSGNKYRDKTFEGTHALYWTDYLKD